MKTNLLQKKQPTLEISQNQDSKLELWLGQRSKIMVDFFELAAGICMLGVVSQRDIIGPLASRNALTRHREPSHRNTTSDSEASEA